MRIIEPLGPTVEAKLVGVAEELATEMGDPGSADIDQVVARFTATIDSELKRILGTVSEEAERIMRQMDPTAMKEGIDESVDNTTPGLRRQIAFVTVLLLAAGAAGAGNDLAGSRPALSGLMAGLCVLLVVLLGKLDGS
jgi:hypothetical protein